jgi:hypothetical protein
VVQCVEPLRAVHAHHQDLAVALGFDDGHGDQLLLPGRGYQLVTLSARLPPASERIIVEKLLLQVPE